MSGPFDRLQRAARVGCPFCLEWIPTPHQEREVFSPEGCLGGRCSCGAVFVIDVTGRLGGQALLDAQALLCGGDLDRAMHLHCAEEVDIETRPYQSGQSSAAMHMPHRAYRGAKVWFMRESRRDPGSFV